jgi:hypothetical protein
VHDEAKVALLTALGAWIGQCHNRPGLPDP